MLHSAHFQGCTFLCWQLHKKFGNVFNLQNCWSNLVVLNGYKAVKEALVHRSEDFADRPYFPVYEHLGYGNKSEGKSLGNRHSPLALAQGGLSRCWVDGRFPHYRATFSCPSGSSSLYVCQPLAVTKSDVMKRGLPLVAAVQLQASTRLFSGVRTPSVIQLPCQLWSW